MMEKDFKIGLLTMHRVINYGSFLQTYATQKVIEDLGYQCEIIDYKYPNKWHFERGAVRRSQLKNMIHAVIKPLGLLSGHRKENKLSRSVKNFYKLSKVYYKTPAAIKKMPPSYDIYITGSDQTWNMRFTKGDTTFLLDFAPASAKKISFSSSLAAKTLDDKYKDTLRRHLPQYAAISIRERNSIDVITELTNKEPEVTLDPTLMLDKQQWKLLGDTANGYINKKRKSSGSYILLYMLSYAFEPRPYIYKLLQQLQEKTGLEVISFTKIPDEYAINYYYCGDAGIEEYLSLFDTAKYVVTSSFHGTAFAINFGIPLYSVVKELNGQDDRQAGFLRSVGADNCIVPIGKAFDTIMPEYDKVFVEKKLNSLRIQSRAYLERNLL